jgi:hypothetical protein
MSDLIHWTTLMQAISTARIEAHRLRKMFDEVATAARDNKEFAEEVYGEIGDTLSALPERLRAVEAPLDRASFVLIHEMESMLRAGLPLSDLTMLDETVKGPGKQASGGFRLSAGLVWAGSRVAGILPAWRHLPPILPLRSLQALLREQAPPFAMRVTARAILPSRGTPEWFAVVGSFDRGA